jgi:hypothetical protein
MAGFSFNGQALTLDVLDGFAINVIGQSSLETNGLPAATKVISYRGLSMPVEVIFPVRITGTSLSNLLANVNTIKGYLSAPTADAVLTFTTAYSDRSWMGQWDGVMPLHFLSKTRLTTEIRFVCQPTMTATTPTTYTGLAWAAGVIKAPVTASPQTVIAGTALTPALYTFSNTGADVAATAFTVTRGGDTITYSDAVPTGTYLRINSETHQAWTSPNGSTWTEVNGKITGSADWVRLSGGTQNTIAVGGVTACTLTIVYTGRFS